MLRPCGRSPKGERAYGTYPHSNSRNVSVIAAVRLSGVVGKFSLLGSTDQVTFDAFMSQHVIKHLKEGDWVIMDNATIHKSEELEAMIQAAGANLCYLPPYSPDFSPIENLISKIKHILRTLAARTYPDLIKAIEYACEQLSLEDIYNCFVHCCHCTS